MAEWELEPAVFAVIQYRSPLRTLPIVGRAFATLSHFATYSTPLAAACPALEWLNPTPLIASIVTTFHPHHVMLPTLTPDQLPPRLPRHPPPHPLHPPLHPSTLDHPPPLAHLLCRTPLPPTHLHSLPIITHHLLHPLSQFLPHLTGCHPFVQSWYAY